MAALVVLARNLTLFLGGLPQASFNRDHCPKDPPILKILRSYYFTTVVTKNTTVVKQYGRVSETPCFPGENSQEISANSELIRRS